MTAGISAFAPAGMAEVLPGSDLVAAILALDWQPADGDLVVVASKIVAKAEGRYVPVADRDAAIDAESVRLVATRQTQDGRLTRVVQTRQGPVLAAAGIDASDVPAGNVLLLPADPDASARALLAGLSQATGRRLGVLVTDTSGRPWRSGVTDFCLGAAGVAVLDDRRGALDSHGHQLNVTIRNIADEIAGLADLVKGKSAGTPVAIVRGLAGVLSEAEESAASLVRTGPSDWFAFGQWEAVQDALLRPSGAATPRHEGPTLPPPIETASETLTERLGRAVALAGALEGAGQVRLRVADGVVEISGGAPFERGRVAERVLIAAHAEGLCSHDAVTDGEIRLGFADSGSR